MRAAVLHHHFAVDVASRLGNQETRQIGKLAVFADPTERISGGPPFIAAFGPKLTRCACGRKRSGRNRDRADAPGSPLHREALVMARMADFAMAEGTVKARPVMVEVERMLSTTPR